MEFRKLVMLWSTWRALFHPITLPSQIDNLKNETDVDSRGKEYASTQSLSFWFCNCSGMKFFCAPLNKVE
jgi:hypothetical protein